MVKKYLILSLFFAGIHGGSSNASDDWELWTELRLKKSLTKTVTLQGVISSRFRDDTSEFYKQFDELGVFVKTSSWLKAESAYHFDYSERLATRDGVYEHRPYASLIPHAKWGAFDVENRNRLEYRDFNGALADDWRYRNRTKASLVLGKDRWWESKPFVSDEFFYGFNAGEMQKNRFIAGVEKSVRENVGVEIFYVLESNKSGRDWNEIHAIGIATTLIF